MVSESKAEALPPTYELFTLKQLLHPHLMTSWCSRASGTRWFWDGNNPKPLVELKLPATT